LRDMSVGSDSSHSSRWWVYGDGWGTTEPCGPMTREKALEWARETAEDQAREAVAMAVEEAMWQGRRLVEAQLIVYGAVWPADPDTGERAGDETGVEGHAAWCDPDADACDASPDGAHDWQDAGAWQNAPGTARYEYVCAEACVHCHRRRLIVDRGYDDESETAETLVYQREPGERTAV